MVWKMIRRIEDKDYKTAINIVNENWKSVYAGYVNSYLLSDIGCQNRAAELQKDFFTCRLEEYVWEEDGHILALLSFGNTEDHDKPGAFEIWRVYVSKDAQGKGVGKGLLYLRNKKRKKMVMKKF